MRRGHRDRRSRVRGRRDRRQTPTLALWSSRRSRQFSPLRPDPLPGAGRIRYIRPCSGAGLWSKPPERAGGSDQHAFVLEDARSSASSRRLANTVIVPNARFDAGLPDLSGSGRRSAGLRPGAVGAPIVQPPALHRTGDFMAVSCRCRAVARGFCCVAGGFVHSRQSAGRRRHQGHRGRDREGSRGHRCGPEDRGPGAAARVQRPGPPERHQGRRHRRGLSGARRERARRGRAVARQGAARGELGQARKGLPGQREGHRASSSTRSRAASRSISTARWRSCRAPRSTSGRSAT